MTTFAEQITADNLALLDTTEFGESVVYYSAGAPSVAKTITAVVDRGQKGRHQKPAETTIEQRLLVTVADSATTGISDPRVGDSIRLAEDATHVRHPFIEEQHNARGLRTLVFRLWAPHRQGRRPE